MAVAQLNLRLQNSMSVEMSCRPLRGEESHGEAVAVSDPSSQ